MERVLEIYKVFFRGQGSTAPTFAQIVEIPGGSLQGSHPGQGSTRCLQPVQGSRSVVRTMAPGQAWSRVFLRTFPRKKKSAKITAHSRGRNWVPQSSSSTATAQLEDSVELGASHGTPRWHRRTSGTDVLTVQAGWLQMVSRSCGTAKRMRSDGSWYWLRGSACHPRYSSGSSSSCWVQELFRQPRAVYKYWAQVTSLCPLLDNFQQSSLDSRMVPLFSSSTAGYCRYATDRYAQAQAVHYGLRLTCPVLCMSRNVDISGVAQTYFPWSVFPDDTNSYSTLARLHRCLLSQVRGARSLCETGSRIPQLQSRYLAQQTSITVSIHCNCRISGKTDHGKCVCFTPEMSRSCDMHSPRACQSSKYWAQFETVRICALACITAIPSCGGTEERHHPLSNEDCWN